MGKMEKSKRGKANKRNRNGESEAKKRSKRDEVQTIQSPKPSNGEATVRKSPRSQDERSPLIAQRAKSDDKKSNGTRKKKKSNPAPMERPQQPKDTAKSSAPKPNVKEDDGDDSDDSEVRDQSIGTAVSLKPEKEVELPHSPKSGAGQDAAATRNESKVFKATVELKSKPKSPLKDNCVSTDSEDTRDSTSSETSSTARKKSPPIRKPALRSRWSTEDTEQYLAGYPNKRDYPNLDQNWRFYKNDIRSVPQGDFIENILEDWKGDFEQLERHHGYIQWLFPIREPGMNYQAQELQLHEAEKIRGDSTCKERVLRAFELMLDFYGMKYDREKKTFERSANWQSRFQHLSRSSHNWLRITRILKCLGELGWEAIKKPWVEFLIHEAYDTKKLAACQRSLTDYWIPVLRVTEEREAMMDLALGDASP